MLQNIIRILMVLYLVLAVVTSFINSTKYKNKFYLPLKLITSAGFLLIYALCEIKATGTAVHWFAIPFIFCFLGDLFMGLNNIRGKEADLLLGIIAFAIGHVAFLVFFYWMDPTFNAIDIIIPIIMFIVTLVLIKKVAPGIGKLAPAVAMYSLFVSALAAKSIHISLSFAFPNYGPLVGVGGVLFLVSDLILFFVCFAGIKSKRTVDNLAIANLVVYYTSILALIIGVICATI